MDDIIKNLKKGVIKINIDIKKLILFLKFNSLIGKHILILTNKDELRKFLIEFGVKKYNGISLDLTSTNEKQISLDYKYGKIFITCMKVREIKKKFNYQSFNIMIGLNRNFYFEKLKKDMVKINFNFPLADHNLSDNLSER